MLYEIRTYRLKNGAIPEYLKVVGEIGITIQKKHLGNLIGYFSSEIGPINEIVHIWAFEASMTARRGAPSWRLIRNGRLSCRRYAT